MAVTLMPLYTFSILFLLVGINYNCIVCYILCQIVTNSKFDCSSMSCHLLLGNSSSSSLKTSFFLAIWLIFLQILRYGFIFTLILTTSKLRNTVFLSFFYHETFQMTRIYVWVCIKQILNAFHFCIVSE